MNDQMILLTAKNILNHPLSTQKERAFIRKFQSMSDREKFSSKIVEIIKSMKVNVAKREIYSR